MRIRFLFSYLAAFVLFAASVGAAETTASQAFWIDAYST
jgi:hypothetical protein